MFNKKMLFLGLLLVCSMSLIACQNKHITLSETELIIEIGEEVVINANSSSNDLIWSSSANEIAIYRAGKIIGLSEGTAIIKVAINDALHVYAKCIVTVLPEEEFIITYNLKNGITENPTLFTRNMLPLKLFPAQKANYDFLGWYLEPNFLTNITEITKPSNIRLYARWQTSEFEKVIDITYELNGGINHPDNPNSIYLSNLPFVLLPATKERYNFLGWFDKADQEVFYIDANIVSPLQIFARWERRPTRIIYHLNGGINHPDNPLEFRESDLPIILFNPTREGYQFFGWFIDLDCSAGWPVTEIFYDSGFDIILYANWGLIHNPENEVYKERWGIYFIKSN
ncbi:MAG: InlB B-repeat-containing protein [Erysipelotrichales bacterium]|nr:InlB B-repeat-containing protein [Erysipelotrichales bacterium]